MEKISTARVAIKWGLICGVLAILFSTILYISGLWESWYVGLVLSIVLYCTCIILSIKEFKTYNNGYMSYSEGLSIGTFVSGVGGILSIMFDYIYKLFIDPEFTTKQLEKAKETYEKFGLSEEQLEEAIAKAENAQMNGLNFIVSVLVYLFFGFLASLLIAGIYQKRKNIFE
jgi:hypothetical protein